METSRYSALTRTRAVVTSILYFVTHVTSVGAVILYGQLLSKPEYIVGSGSDRAALVGVLFEIILALGIVGTGVVLFPAMKHQDEGIALGYVGLRTLEASVIAVGVVPLLAIISMRQQLATLAVVDTATLTSIGNALMTFHNWTFLVGPGYICGANTVLMAYLMYKSGYVPRFIAILGLIGGPLVFASAMAQMFGIYEQISVWAGLAAMPVFAWEILLASWLLIKGFTPAQAPSARPVAGEHFSAA